jgi:hypothetical protein
MLLGVISATRSLTFAHALHEATYIHTTLLLRTALQMSAIGGQAGVNEGAPQTGADWRPGNLTHSRFISGSTLVRVFFCRFAIVSFVSGNVVEIMAT